MGANYFNGKQIEELSKNPYVKKVSEKAITYEEGFKELFAAEYEKGKLPSQIFKEYGFDVAALGKERINSFSKRIRKQKDRESGFEDQRKYSSGRPRTKDLTAEEKIERLELKLKTLKQENDFLKRVRYINRKQLSKQSYQQEKSTNSSKET
ncbi:MAG: hypothetical protein IKO38_08350 [Erysipelotrichaceae bacterium]|nr:hypothetical protein [Erysipelotrichaceae bacterium]